MKIKLQGTWVRLDRKGYSQIKLQNTKDNAGLRSRQWWHLENAYWAKSAGTLCKKKLYAAKAGLISQIAQQEECGWHVYAELYIKAL